ncbi:MAG: hypothetical protein K2Q22_16380 [Cytophagales bacterium]|nr:hypothetical protein [Cytophagales bacterium]
MDLKKFKNPMFIGVFFFITFCANAQYHEIGLSVGALNYKGELSPEVHPFNYRPGMNLFYRYNFNPDIAWKNSLMVGQIAGDDRLWNLPLNKYRDARFASILVEIASMVEYNFFSYRKAKGGEKFTVYLTGGLAAYFYETRVGSPVMPALPVGVGFKYAFLKQFNLGFEFGSRFLFSDLLDKTNDSNNTSRPGNPNDVDMYLYNGVWVSYTFYEVNCPGHYVW